MPLEQLIKGLLILNKYTVNSNKFDEVYFKDYAVHNGTDRVFFTIQKRVSPFDKKELENLGFYCQWDDEPENLRNDFDKLVYYIIPCSEARDVDSYEEV